jgi:hypothetical protein
MSRRGLIGALAFVAVACVRSPTPPPPPTTVRAVAVFPPNNRTGDDLLVEGGSLLERYAFHTERVTVGDVLAAEARRQLEERGVDVIAPELVDAAVRSYAPLTAETAARQAARDHVDADVLYIEIRRWEPDAPFQPTRIIVSLAATLIEPADGEILWHLEQPSRPIATPGAVTLGAADIIAAQSVIQDLLAPLASPHHAAAPSEPASSG